MLRPCFQRLTAIGLIGAAASLAQAGIPANVQPAKNIIVMIPDGMSVTGTTLARWMNGGDKPLAMDELACGLIRTYPSDAIVNDSAPAATAYACGITAQTGNIGVYPDALTMPGLKQPKPDGINNLSPAANIMEAARLQGRGTGLVVTCELPHATPADFAAHDPSRKNYDNIGEQEVYAGFDVMLGAGLKFFGPDVRKDKEDLVSVIKAGYDLVQDTAALKASSATKLWGSFEKPGETDLGYDLDRDPARIPSLSEMTEKAVSVLSRNPKGFVLMVEGSLIDWAAHANDPVGIYSDINAFDKAVASAMDFARKDGNTVVLIMADHGNSGLSIGNASTTSGYDTLPMKAVVGPLKKAIRTAQGVADLINAGPLQHRRGGQPVLRPDPRRRRARQAQGRQGPRGPAGQVPGRAGRQDGRRRETRLHHRRPHRRGHRVLRLRSSRHAAHRRDHEHGRGPLHGAAHRRGPGRAHAEAVPESRHRLRAAGRHRPDGLWRSSQSGPGGQQGQPGDPVLPEQEHRPGRRQAGQALRPRGAHRPFRAARTGTCRRMPWPWCPMAPSDPEPVFCLFRRGVPHFVALALPLRQHAPAFGAARRHQPRTGTRAHPRSKYHLPTTTQPCRRVAGPQRGNPCRFT